MFLAYASERGAGFVDRSLYLPREWTNDPSRRAEAGVPEEVTFANKIELAKRMLQRAFAAGIPRPVGSGGLLLRPLPPVPQMAGGARSTPRGGVPKTNAVRIGGRRKKIERLAERLPERACSEVLPAADAKIDAPGSGLAWSYPPIRPRTCVDGYCSAVTPKTRMTSVSTKPTAPRGRPSRN